MEAASQNQPPVLPTTSPAADQNLARRRIKFKVAAAVLIAGLLVAAGYYWYSLSYESTDDAFIEGHLIAVSPRVAGHVAAVHVDDNQQVAKNQLLIEIDPRDFQARLDQARAALQAAVAQHKTAQINLDLTKITSTAAAVASQSAVDTAQAQLSVARSRLPQVQAQILAAQANVEQARADVIAAEAEATRTKTDLERFTGLLNSEAASRQQLDYAVAAAQAAAARVTAVQKKVAAAEAQVAEAQANQQIANDNIAQAQAQLAEAQARLVETNVAPQKIAAGASQLDTATAQIAQLQAQVDQAQLNLSYTKILAPDAGRVTKKNVEIGEFLQPGQSLLALVPQNVWVVANFKETQLDRMRPGQEVRIKVDAYPDKVFRGRVDSIQSGTGARFSLLPPENATGNYVKVVQRVPVKIVFDEPPDSAYLLAPGMSVIPRVKVR
jgi:membrane fusion protein, multidrug efflux system